MNNYKIEIFWSKRDEAFVGIAPAFDGLAVVADSREEALREAETAIETYLQIYREDGIPIPVEDEVAEYSGQVRLRLSKYQHQKSAQRAEVDGVSLNSYFTEAIASRNGMHEFVERLLERVMAIASSPVVRHRHEHRHIWIKNDGTKNAHPGYPGAEWKGSADNLEYGEVA